MSIEKNERLYQSAWCLRTMDRAAVVAGMSPPIGWMLRRVKHAEFEWIHASQSAATEGFTEASIRALADKMQGARPMDPPSAKPSPTPPWWPCYVTPHAVQRYRDHYPDADVFDVGWDLAHGSEMDRELVWALTSRVRNQVHLEWFILGQDGRGIFVVVPSDGHRGGVAVTYIRLSDTQRAILEK